MHCGSSGEKKEKFGETNCFQTHLGLFSFLFANGNFMEIQKRLLLCKRVFSLVCVRYFFGWGEECAPIIVKGYSWKKRFTWAFI